MPKLCVHAVSTVYFLLSYTVGVRQTYPRLCRVLRTARCSSSLGVGSMIVAANGSERFLNSFDGPTVPVPWAAPEIVLRTTEDGVVVCGGAGPILVTEVWSLFSSFGTLISFEFRSSLPRPPAELCTWLCTWREWLLDRWEDVIMVPQYDATEQFLSPLALNRKW